jgi:hypothetical protein
MAANENHHPLVISKTCLFGGVLDLPEGLSFFS